MIDLQAAAGIVFGGLCLAIISAPFIVGLRDAAVYKRLATLYTWVLGIAGAAVFVFCMGFNFGAMAQLSALPPEAARFDLSANYELTQRPILIGSLSAAACMLYWIALLVFEHVIKPQEKI